MKLVATDELSQLTSLHLMLLHNHGRFEQPYTNSGSSNNKILNQLLWYEQTSMKISTAQLMALPQRNQTQMYAGISSILWNILSKLIWKDAFSIRWESGSINLQHNTMEFSQKPIIYLNFLPQFFFFVIFLSQATQKKRN